MNWTVEEDGFKKENIEFFGSKFSVGNGYMGYRGTLEEYGKSQLVSLTLAGLYNDAGGGWREPVNAPNPFYFKLSCDGEPLDCLKKVPEIHRQKLCLRNAVHSRESVFTTTKGKQVKLMTERFASADDPMALIMKYSFVADTHADIVLMTAIDDDVWDMNGPHLKNMERGFEDGCGFVRAQTTELTRDIAVAEATSAAFGLEEQLGGQRVITLSAEAKKVYTLYKFAAVCKGKDAFHKATSLAKRLEAEGYDALFARHKAVWELRWKQADIVIKGDDEAQIALRYSMYLLLSFAPFHTDEVAIPARGLSGQVYKGAMFWDTEIYMLPFFAYVLPEAARNLVRYRVNTLGGARRKAAEYGYRGAFYAWESQETGDDSCTLYNLTDIFTGRAVRTYFRDKQIHISADVAYGVWLYYTLTGDEDFLLRGGAEVILECARFYVSCAYYKKDKNRYELLDVTGADEYHERVHNNGYTNAMAKQTLESALECLNLLRSRYPADYTRLLQDLDYEKDIDDIAETARLMYVPKPNANGLIEQFDGYFKLEDARLEDIKSRIIKPNEYLGSPCGLCVNTQIIKQADIVLMLYLLRNKFPQTVKGANWRYYEPRTEHGSSLSTCVYALLAADIGEIDWAYKFFMKTATIDLNGGYKLYLGDAYIGGTHPAANGGSWMACVQGFGGLNVSGSAVVLNPRLPKHWDGLAYRFSFLGQVYAVDINKNSISVEMLEGNKDCRFIINGSEHVCRPGEVLYV